MKSVADGLRLATLARVLAMTPEQRMALALTLGDEDLDRYAEASGLEREEALRRLRLGRQRGRAPSRCAALDAS